MIYLEAYYLVGIAVFIARLLTRPLPAVSWDSVIEQIAHHLSDGDPLNYYGEEERFFSLCRSLVAVAAMIGVAMMPLYWPTMILRWKR